MSLAQTLRPQGITPTSTADIRHMFQEPQAGKPAPFVPTLALTVNLAFASFLAAMGMVLLVKHPVPIPCLPLEQNQHAETLLYLLAFLVILPMALVVGPHLTNRIARGPNRAGLEALTGLLAVALALVIFGTRASNRLGSGDTVRTALFAAAIWWVSAGLAIWRAAQRRSWDILLRVSGAAGQIWAVAGLLAFIVLLCLTDLRSGSPRAVVLGVALVVGGLTAFECLRPPSVGRRWRLGCDALLIVLLLLAVQDLIVARPEQAPGNPGVAIETWAIQFHQNFLLGPANEVLAGGAMLVDTASQYGVLVIYLLVGWFRLAPVGYGTLGFFSGVCSALAFAAGYCVLRIAGTSRVLSAGTFVVAVIALVFNTEYPINSIPQDSTLRFGLPIGVLLALVAGERWPRYHALAWVAAVTVAAIASLWSLEAFTFTLGTLAAMVSVATWLRPTGNRLRWLLRQVLMVAVACVCAHVCFALVTLAVYAQLPDWGQYLAYLHAFLFEDLGDINFDFPPWSPGLALGAGYLTSIAAIVLLVVRDPDFARTERTAISALTGVTAYGVAIYSYYDNRSTSFILTAVALPAFLAAALWLSLLLRSHVVPLPLRRGGLLFALSVAGLVVTVSWSSVAERYPHSALAHVLAGGGSVRQALHRLWHMPSFSPAASEGQRLLERYMSGEPRSLVLIAPDSEIEVLVRSNRGNVLPIASPLQDGFIASKRVPGLGRAVDGLRPGQRMLIDEPARETFETVRANPSIDPLARPDCAPGKAPLVPAKLAPLQAWALKRIGERFDLRTVYRGSSGLAIVELIPRG